VGREDASVNLGGLKSWIWIACVAAVLRGVVSPAFGEQFARPGPGDEPTRIEGQILVLDLDAVDGAGQTFVASVYYRFRWHDPRLAGQQTKPSLKSLDEVWHPGLLVVNQTRGFSGLSDVVRVDPDGTVTHAQRVWGHFSQPMHLAEFPLDGHELDVTLVATRAEPGEVEFVPMADQPSGIGEKLSIAGWDVHGADASALMYQPTTNTPPVPGYQVRVNVTRQVGYYLFKMVLPLVLIVAMSWITFWIDPTEAGTQIAVATTSMLTLIAYQFLLSNMLPPVSYLTRLDAFILISTVLVFASLIEVIVTARLAQKDRLALTQRVDAVSRATFPLAFVILLGFSFIR
jgi:hypothetical protein